jgi:malate dehydrogenase (oxaloacetate-decarboxylating)(NADP+)
LQPPELIKSKIYTSAVALSKTINQHELDEGRLYPNITRIREVSVVVAREVIRQAQREDLDHEKSIRNLSDAELDAWIQDRMYDPAAQDGVEESGNVAEVKVKSRL